MSDDKKGMLRHVDVLGRVVIPREVRKSLRINYGDLMEFSACSNKQVIMRKYYLIREISGLANTIVKVSCLGKDINILVTDTEQLVCHNGDEKKEKEELDSSLIDIIKNRQPKTYEGCLKITENMSVEGQTLVSPVISEGDVLGAVIVNNRSGLNEIDEVLGKEITHFLANYFEAE